MRPLKLLIAEDNPDDAELLLRTLRLAGFDPQWSRVETKEAFLKELEKHPHIVLSDYSMPQFSGLEALELTQMSDQDVPLILISGTVGEDVAVEAMRAGAKDYLMKYNLTRLVPTIERELKATENRRQQRRAENERRVIFEIIQGAIATPNLDEFLKLVHRSINQVMYAKNCFVMLHDDATDMISFEFWVDKHDLPEAPKPLGTGFASYVLRTNKPMRLTRELKQKLKEEGKAVTVGTPSASWLGVPLHTPQRTIGVLVLQHYEDENAYSEHDLEFLSSVGDQIALAIERKRAEEKLLRSEESYRDLIENAHDIIYSHDLEGNYTSINAAVEHITGYTREESMQMNLSQIVVPAQLDRARDMIARKLRGEKMTAYEVEILAKDGRVITVEINTKLVLQNGVPVGIQGIARDVTERKSLEEQLSQSQKLESLGRLAGGIAHDFNNMLTAINGYSEIILRKIGDSDPMRKNIEEIKKAGIRAAMLTNQLLVFSRQQILQPEVIAINDAIAEISAMLERLIGEDIELATVFKASSGNVKADPGQLGQIVMNLAVNARDAMLNGGKLTIETDNVFVDQDYASQHVGVLPGAYVLLTVSDTGVGIPPELQERIFEPFFTTKEVGKGTGLGLATVYGIVKQSGGGIFVYSEVGHGTTFKIYLPRVMEKSEGPFPQTATKIEPTRGSETILLVEDEEQVRALSRQVLESYGYTVIEARDGIEALDVLESTGAHVDLLFTDVIMPRMGGRDLTEKLLTNMPDLPVLFASGYTGDTVVRHGELDTNVNFIQKPYSLDDLARKVRDLLDLRK